MAKLLSVTERVALPVYAERRHLHLASLRRQIERRERRTPGAAHELPDGSTVRRVGGRWYVSVTVSDGVPDARPEHGTTRTWIPLQDEDRNPDLLQEPFTPRQGCPTCGSAWGEVDAVAINALVPCAHGIFVPDADRWGVLPYCGRSVPIVEVELWCLEGHPFRYDGVRYRLPPRPWLGGPILGGLGVLGVAYMYGEAYTSSRKGAAP